MGSYARGAPDVGDVDLVLEIDEPRSRGQQGLDAFYRRAHPYAEVVTALGCGSGSFVNIEVVPVFSEGRDVSGPVTEPHEPPLMGHVITDEPFDPQPVLRRRCERRAGFGRRRALIGEPPPCSSEIERPSAARPSKIPEKHIEPTAAGSRAEIRAVAAEMVRNGPSAAVNGVEPSRPARGKALKPGVWGVLSDVRLSQVT